MAGVLVVLETILGLAPVTKPRALYSLLVLVGVLFNFLATPEGRKALRLIHDISNVCTFASCILTSFVIRGNLIKMVEKLRTLQDSYPGIFVGAWLMLITVTTLCNVLTIFIKFNSLYLPVTYCFTNYVTTVYCLQFNLYLYNVALYLQKLTVELKTANSKEGLMDIRMKYSAIWFVSRIININHNIPITMIFTCTFFNVTETSYSWLKNDYHFTPWQVLDSCCWLSINIIRLILITATCEKITGHIQELAVNIHVKIIKMEQQECVSMLQQFSLQLMNEVIEFWACGLFKLNNNLLYSMLGAITTYSVLIVQLND